MTGQTPVKKLAARLVKRRSKGRPYDWPKTGQNAGQKAPLRPRARATLRRASLRRGGMRRPVVKSGLRLFLLLRLLLLLCFFLFLLLLQLLLLSFGLRPLAGRGRGRSNLVKHRRWRGRGASKLPST